MNVSRPVEPTLANTRANTKILVLITALQFSIMLL